MKGYKIKQIINPKKYLLLFLGVVILITSSELLYLAKNNQNFQVNYYLLLSRIFAFNSDTQRSLNYFGKAAELKLKDAVKEHPNTLNGKSVKIPQVPDNPTLHTEFNKQLQNLNTNNLPNEYVSKWAKIFYALGLEAYRQDEPDFASDLWQNSIYLAPEWSYFHIESANLYLRTGSKNQADSQIQFCVMFRYPKNHCLEFFEQNINKNISKNVGAWENEINKI